MFLRNGYALLQINYEQRPLGRRPQIVYRMKHDEQGEPLVAYELEGAPPTFALNFSLYTRDADRKLQRSRDRR